MSEIRSCTVIIESVQGDTPGLAAGISYTCTIVYEDGTRSKGVKGIKPEGDRWQPPVKIDAAKPRGVLNADGTVASGMWPGRLRGPEGAQVLSAYINELPHVEPCAP